MGTPPSDSVWAQDPPCLAAEGTVDVDGLPPLVVGVDAGKAERKTVQNRRKDAGFTSVKESP